ncbi:hypothetical protein Clacol_010073 [Clathrus columnatus]|uniref:Uncharacterized protein n=1 Tax=Clathrus columnatus TaxID=1419009 RepID=A0AAV5AMY5_9AGAM|nr:hypothetical protein Clacol_010073 [Clathrus columnatus]
MSPSPSTSSRVTPADNLGKRPNISPSRRRAKSFDPMSQATVFSDVSSSTIMHSNRTPTRVRTQTAEQLHVLDQPRDYRREPLRIDGVHDEIRLFVEQELDADDDIEPDSDMITSFYSEGGDRRSGRGKHVSWGRTGTSRDRDYTHTTRRRQRSGSLGLTTTHITEEPLSVSPTTLRGRPTTPRRMTDSGIESGDDLSADSFEDSGKPISTYNAIRFPSDPSDMDQVDSTPLTHSRSRSRSRVRRASSALSEATSRRSASIVFLGVMILIGFSKLDHNYSPTKTQGNVLIPLDTYHSDLHISSLFPRNSPTATFIDDQTEQFIGRLAAWTCTTLYLTSRLPQIWKNGLSMYLFTFAFFGNLFYVLSILTSPNMNLPPEQSRQFLRDSVPYLLGSGGTLLFDVTIVSQSFIYTSTTKRDRKKRRRSRTLSSALPSTRGRMRLGSRRSLDDEERGLLQDNGTVVGDRGNDAT